MNTSTPDLRANTAGDPPDSSTPSMLVRVWYGLLIPLLLVAIGLGYWLSGGRIVVAVVGGVTWFALILIGGLLASRARG